MKYNESDFAGMDALELRTLIVNEEESLQKRDEAMYYLLNERLIRGLMRKFAPYLNEMEDDFEDVLLDFFLYLRGEDGMPYRKLLRIGSDASFEGWVVISFRNFAGKRAALARRLPKSSTKTDCLELQNVDSIPLDRLIRMLSTLVAYCCQELSPVNRFVFLRMLLTMLDKNRALPDKEVAASLGITDVYYRVISYRLRAKVQTVKEMLLTETPITLTVESRRLADELNDDFSDWYQIIAGCYEAALNYLPQSKAIGALRANYMSQNDGMLYDSALLTYGYTPTHSNNRLTDPKDLWNALGAPRSS